MTTIKNHFIVAGAGSTGRHVLDEIVASGKACLLIDRDEARLAQVRAEIFEQSGIKLAGLLGDATEDATLREAAVERADGIVFALGNDRDNLFATITARSMSPKVRIVTRGENPESEQKFIRAGATSVIFTNVLGGLRMAAEVIRPEVTGFLDLMMRDHGEVRRIEELEVPARSPLIGKTLREANLRSKTDALIVATYDKRAAEYTFSPGPDAILTEDTKLIVLVLIRDVPALEALLRGES